jgi:two-component system, NtrC family, response regulator AtoC
MEYFNMGKAQILFAEDQATTREFVGMILTDAGYAVDSAADGMTAIEWLGSKNYDLVLSDLKLGDISGLDVLKKAVSKEDPPTVVIITAHGSIENAVEAIKMGAYDYLTKPVSSDELLHTVKRGIENKLLKSRVKKLESQIEREYKFENLIAKSPKSRQLIDTIRQVASSDATVLIQGESGTGKELVARAVHVNSKRNDNKFVAINCGAMPETLLESELFGYIKGSFTGADENRKGLFEEADGGSLFLDEIGETTPTFQVKLLRALQEGEIRRVGDKAPIKVDVRIIAASNKNLKEMVEKETFRQDLFYRINVIPILIPPLKERKEDILPLAEYFIEKHIQKNSTVKPGLDRQTINLLEAYPWPGNVRELENVIERALVLTKTENIMPEDLPGEVQNSDSAEASLNASISMKDIEKKHIMKVLEITNWNQTEAAKLLGIGYNTLWRKIKAYEIKKP